MGKVKPTKTIEMAKKTKTKENTIEMYSRWYLEELIEHGYIKEIQREPETLICAYPLKHRRLRRFKRKPHAVENFNLFPEISYTYDFKIIWDKSARYLFYDIVDKDDLMDRFIFGKPIFVANIEYDEPGNEIHVTRVDVKPTSAVGQKGGKTGSATTFPIKARMIYERTGIYVDKFIPIPMAGSGETIAKFCISFTPKRYFFTDANGSQRLRKHTNKDGSPKWFRKDLKTYVKNRLRELEYQMNYGKTNQNTLGL